MSTSEGSESRHSSGQSPIPRSTNTPAVKDALGRGNISDSDFKDTVLFLQQQQQLQYRELLSAIQGLSQKVDQQPANSPDKQRSVHQSQLSSGLLNDISVLTGSAYIASLPQEPFPTSDKLKDAELHAARARITALEAQVASLQKQLDSKEAAIRRLSEVAMRDAVQRVSISSSSARGALSSYTNTHAGLTAQPPRAVLQHSDAVQQIRRLDTSTPAHLRTADDNSLTTTARELLRQHEAKTLQLLNTASY